MSDTLRSVPWAPIPDTYDAKATGVRTKQITPNGTSRCPYERRASGLLRLAEHRATSAAIEKEILATIEKCDREIDERPTLQAPPPSSGAAG
jgi:hypothetical protein